jgi:malonate transporter
MSQLLFSANSVLPVFIIIFVGIILRKTRVIDEGFVNISSDLVFKVALPALIFSEIAETDFYRVFEGKLILFACAAVAVSFVVAWMLAPLTAKTGKERGAFVQGAFRGNVAILGLAVMENIFGPTGVAKGAIILAFLLPIYNILAVVALTLPLAEGEKGSAGKIAKSIATNPLIISVLFALPFSIFRIELPYMVSKSVSYLSSISVPLALIGIGGSLSLEAFKRSRCRRSSPRSSVS